VSGSYYDERPFLRVKKALQAAFGAKQPSVCLPISVCRATARIDLLP
jgi:hypothetical protein